MAIMEGDYQEEEVLFEYTTTTTTPSYFVQSPSTTISNANSFEFHPNSSHINQIHHLSPLPIIQTTVNPSPEASRRFTFSSRCSSSRESLTHLFVNVDHKSSVPYNDEDDRKEEGSKSMLRDYGGVIDDEKDGGYGGDGGWRKYLSFGTYDGLVWMCLQLSWRLMVSLAAALLVFYVATKPPSPLVSVKVAGIREFELGEGVDASGVSTKIMSCNATVEVAVDNQSKVFALHLRPPTLQMSFQGFTFASSRGKKLVAERQRVTRLEMHVGMRSKPMYGAGRMMQDMLNSGPGLPLRVGMDLVSRYRILGGFIRSRFRHRAQCLVVVVKGYDSRRRTQRFNATCTVTTS